MNQVKLVNHLGQPGHSYRSTKAFNKVILVIYLGQPGQLTKSTWSFIQVTRSFNKVNLVITKLNLFN